MLSLTSTAQRIPYWEASSKDQPWALVSCSISSDETLSLVSIWTAGGQG